MRTISAGSAQRCAPNGFSGVAGRLSSLFSVSGSAAISASPPASSAEATPPRSASPGRTASARGGRRAARGSSASSSDELLVPRDAPRPRARASGRLVLDCLLRLPRPGRSRAGARCSSARCASRPAVRARIGTAFTTSGEKPRSSSTAAIGMATFIVSGLPDASATASRNARASATCGPLTPRSSASSRIRSARGSSGLCTGWPKPGHLAAGLVRSRRTISAATVAAPLPAPARRRADARTPRTCRARPGRRRGSPRPPRPGATPGRRRASSARRRSSASSRARRSRRAAGRGSSAAPRSARLPVSSRWKYSVNVSSPMRSPARSRPRTSTRSG